MNIELLDRIVKHAEEVPERFLMETWYSKLSPEEDLEERIENLDLPITPEQVPPCGAVACIAGTACILTGKAVRDEEPDEFGIFWYEDPRGGWFDTAAKELDLNYKQACRLFFHTQELASANGSLYCWPEQFTNAYVNSKTSAERVAVLKTRIAHFIATDGQE